MNQLNSLIIEGNVTRAPKTRSTPNGYKVCTVPIAVNRFYKNLGGEGINEVSYFNIEAFGKLADACEKNCDKGRGMRVVGRLKQNRWTTEEGKNTSRVTIVAEHVEFKKRFAPAAATSEEKLAAIKEANMSARAQEESLAEQAEFQEEEAVAF